ncbi:MAG: carbohydrate binding family 9 domain-containing protein [bacterium]|nr:carbohydrate binding family 9 domain-containing protein [bacterium]
MRNMNKNSRKISVDSIPVIFIFVFTIIFTTSFLPARSHTTPLEISRVKSPVELDGLSNEAAWAGIKPYTMVGIIPHAGKKPSEHTELLLGYDDRNLYVAGRLFDKDASKIQANSMKRDSRDLSSEWFGITIDTFNDKENGLAFFTTPTGLRWDSAIINDCRSTPWSNENWNAHWDVAVKRNGKGWFVEMRIPFKSLRFQPKNGRVVMGIISWRYLARKEEYVIFPAIPPDWGTVSRFKVSQAQEVVLKDISSRKPIYFSPYILGGTTRNWELNENNTYSGNNEHSLEGGFDLKYGISNNLTLDVTVNTDFAQVEADEQQINLSRFSLFFPEKRQFFQERSSNFDFNFDKYNRLFYSRNIGIRDGIPQRILGGARMVGRIGQWDIGVLNMQTGKLDEHPTENFGVFRLRRQVFNRYSSVGAIVTTRIAGNGTYNTAYGLDGTFKLFRNDFLSVKYAQTFEKDGKNKTFSAVNSRYKFVLMRKTQKAFYYRLSHSYAGADYNPGIGFERRKDYSRLSTFFGYGWQPGQESFLFSHKLSASIYGVWRNQDDTVESAEFAPFWTFRTKSGFTGKIVTRLSYESIREPFFLDDNAEVLAGDYSFFETRVTLTTPMGNPFYISSDVKVGSLYDGSRISLALSPTWCVSPTLELSASYRYNDVRFSEREQRFEVHLVRIRALYTPNVKLSGSAFVQYNNSNDAVIANIRLRYNPGEGNDFYIVYNEDFNTNRGRENPRLPFSQQRTVMLKYTYSFQL